MRHTRGRSFQAAGIAVPKPGGMKELDMFQKQETSPCDNSVGHREKSNEKCHWVGMVARSVKTLNTVELYPLNGCKKGDKLGLNRIEGSAHFFSFPPLAIPFAGRPVNR